MALLYFKLNSKVVFYKVTAYGIESEFGLRPIVLNTNHIGRAERIPITIRNPDNNQSLIIYSAIPQDKRVSIQYNAKSNLMCCTQANSVVIPPLSAVNVFNVSFTLHSTEVLFTLIKLRCQSDLTLVIALSVKVKHAIASPEILNFGIVDPSHPPHRIMLTLDTSYEALVISEIFRKKSSNFVLHLYDFPQRLFPKSSTPHVIGYVGFYASSPGLYENRISLIANSSWIIKLELRARVIESPLFYDLNIIHIDVTNKAPEMNHMHKIALKDDINEFENIIDLESDYQNATIMLSCADLHEETQCAFESTVLTLQYQPLENVMYPFTRHICLWAGATLLHVPIIFDNSNLMCHYNENNSPSIIRKQCNRLDKINLGVFGGSLKSMDLHLVNSALDPMNIFNLSLKHESTFCCLELLTMDNGDAVNFIKNCSHGKFTSFSNDCYLQIQPKSTILLRLYLSLNNCGKNSTMKTIDGDSFSNWLSFTANNSSMTIKLEYAYRSGDISLSPSRMRFEPAFSGTVQSKKLWAVSTFKIPLKILNIWTTDKRVELLSITRQIKEESKSEIGTVKFLPDRSQEEERFAEQKQRILSWAESRITLGELKLWREIEMIWETISGSGDMVIDSEVFVDTDIMQAIKLPVKAEITRPILVQENELYFQLIKNGSHKEMSVTIYNPSTNPLKIQLFSTNPHNGNYKADLPLSFFPRARDCQESYTLWARRYEATMQQLRDKRRLTEYNSTEEFKEDYCCYMGKYNSSILYAQKLDELINNDIERYCYSKSVAGYFPESSLKKEVETSNLKRLWKMMIKKTKDEDQIDTIETSSFSIPSDFSQNYTIIPPLSYRTIGPIVYSPNTVGEHTGLIFIKNDLTVLYPIRLRGESGVGTLEFIEEANPLLKLNRLISVIPKEHFSLKNYAKTSEVEFKLTQADLLMVTEKTNASEGSWLGLLKRLFKAETYPFKVRKSHLRIFTVRNIGNMPLTVNRISIDDRGCTAYKINIQDCRNFSLEPQQSYRIAIDFTASLAISSSKHFLVFHTESGRQTFDLSIKLPFNILAVLQQFPQLEEYSFN